MLKNHQLTTPGIQKAYDHYDLDLRRKRLKIMIPLAVFFIMLFGVLDLIIYPEIISKLIILRVVCDAFLIAIFCVIFYQKWLNIKFAGYFLLLLISVLINVLIFFTDGVSSPYYAGLNLALIAFSAMLPWRVYETLFSFVMMLFSYLVACVAHAYVNNLEYDLPLLTNNLFFLVSVGIFCVISTYLNDQLRLREFISNYTLDYNLKAETLKLRSTQAQLVHSEKMNAIGNLSAGLLHEVNNPLNYTMIALQVMKMEPSINSDSELKETVKDIEEGMNRIKNIVTDLKAFAYPEEADKKNRFPILDVITSTLRFTASECQDIEKIVNVAPDLMVSASKTHIVQVLINLISNAARAIGKSGNKKGIMTIDAKAENDRVVISVSDNGIGINAEDLGKVFDPFFTTNEVGKGMGLGLSVSHTIIKNHGGNLDVVSKFGEGSRFYFDLAV